MVDGERKVQFVLGGATIVIMNAAFYACAYVAERSLTRLLKSLDNPPDSSVLYATLNQMRANVIVTAIITTFAMLLSQFLILRYIVFRRSPSAPATQTHAESVKPK